MTDDNNELGDNEVPDDPTPPTGDEKAPAVEDPGQPDEPAETDPDSEEKP